MFKFAIKNLLTRKAKFIMTTIAIIVSSLIILFSFNVAGQINDGIVSTASYYDVVVGPVGSSTDLVMTTMFFTGTTSDTIDSSIYDELKQNRNVREVVPFATGDNYKGAQIVGTDAGFLEKKTLQEGEYFDDAFEVVLGYNVAKDNDLSIGDKLVGSHGVSESAHSHDNSPYTIVGILDKTYTAYDNALFASVDSVWKTHESHDEHEHNEAEHVSGEATEEIVATTKEHVEEHGNHNYTALLIKSANPSAALNLISELNKEGGVIAVNPATVLRDLRENIDIAKNIVYVLCGVIGVMSFVIIYMITLMMMQDMRKDVMLFRLLGLQRKNIFFIIFIQNMIVGLAGILIAFGLTRFALLLTNNITASMGIVINHTKVYAEEYLIMAIIFVVSLVPTFISLIKMFKRSLEDEK